MRLRRRRLAAWVADVAVVAGFVAIGRSSHDEGPTGYLGTLLPFFAALQLAWVLIGASPSTLRAGAIVWATTVAGGLLLRVGTGDTAAPGFVVVTTFALGVGLFGWRLLAQAARTVRTRSHRRRASGASS